MKTAPELLETVKSIYNTHKAKLVILKENRSKLDTNQLNDSEIQSFDEQIELLASILSDLNRLIILEK